MYPQGYLVRFSRAGEVASSEPEEPGEGGEGNDKGTLKPNLKHIKKVAFVTSYGGDRFRTMLMGDPPRRLARRWAWVTFGTLTPPKYLALYDMNNCTPERLQRFIAKVRAVMERW